MNNAGQQEWLQGAESRDLEWLTELLEQRTFNNFTSKHILELFMSLKGMRSVQVFAATRKQQQLTLELTHCSGDLAIESSGATQQIIHAAFQQQHALFGHSLQYFGVLPNTWQTDQDSHVKQASHLYLPMRINNTCVGVVVLVLEPGFLNKQPIKWIKLLTAVLSQCLCSTLLPNFVTLYARPYQRVEEGELLRIQDVLHQCGGNKTMAAKVLNMTPRQLRYRLEKLQPTEALSA